MKREGRPGLGGFAVAIVLIVGFTLTALVFLGGTTAQVLGPVSNSI